MKLDFGKFLSEIPFDPAVLAVFADASIFTVFDLVAAMKDRQLPEGLSDDQKVKVIEVVWEHMIGLPLNQKG